MATSDSDSGRPSDGELPRIVTTDGVLGGAPRIDGTRIGVSQIYRRYVDGDETPESIADGFDLSVAAVHAALAYAFHNAAEMEAIEEREPDLPGQRVTPGDDE